MPSKRALQIGSVVVALAAAAAVSLVGVGSAASQAVPVNTSPPTISGTAREGETLTAGNGTWTGTPPIAYTYEWVRCERNGTGCAAIGGATSRTYLLKQQDVGNTVRVRVTASNNDGSATAQSAQTAVVAEKDATTPSGCPAGTGPVSVSTVTSPARLLIDGQRISPSPVGGSTTSVTVRFHVSACGGRAVQGALVYGTAVPYNQFTTAEQPTGADGWATLVLNRRAGYPATPQQQLLVVFARARKPGEPLLGGISTRRLVSFPVRLSR
ncbi:MAG TPA: hypothetical protein VF044_05845 [Actinomycetota bacterium]